MYDSRVQGLGSKAEVEYLRAAVSETPRSDLQAGGVEGLWGLGQELKQKVSQLQKACQPRWNTIRYCMTYCPKPVAILRAQALMHADPTTCVHLVASKWAAASICEGCKLSQRQSCSA